MVLLLLCLGILPDIPAALSLNFHSRNHVKLKATSNFLQHWGYRAYSSQTAAEHDRARRTATVLRMVLTTPESIIEQASTEKLIDILIDESVRTSARRPIMMQVRSDWCTDWHRCFDFPLFSHSYSVNFFSFS